MHYTSKSFPVLVIIGPSGSGKSTAIRQLSKRQLIEIVPTWTTRQPRPDEINNGMEHKFVTYPEFRDAENEKLLLVTRQMFGLPFWYGLPVIHKPKNELVQLIVLRASLIDLFSQYYTNYIIYQIEDTLPRIKQRLLERTQHGEALGLRTDGYEKEIIDGRKLAKRVFVNGNSDELVNSLEEALLKDFSRNITQ